MVHYSLPALIFYLYTTEIKKARAGGDWNPVFAAVAIFGADFLNESWNGWVMILSGRSALWTTPGPTALRTTVGWNIEIMFMFAILGFVFYHSPSNRPKARLLGIPEKWFFAWAILAIGRKTIPGKVPVCTLPYAAAVVLDLIALGLGWRY